MKKIFLAVLFICLWVPSNILAANCTDTQIKRFKQLANEIKTTFDYEEQNGKVIFTINFHNVNQDLYLVDYDTFDVLTIYDDNDSGIIRVPNYEAGKTFTFSVLNKKAICTPSIITKINVTTPNFNKYYSDPLCTGIETYSLCQKWNNVGGISYNTFKSRVEDYKKQQNVEIPKEEDKIEDNFWNRVRNFIASYYLYIVVLAGLVFVIGVIIYKKRKKLDW